jgi:hypothetical protein
VRIPIRALPSKICKKAVWRIFIGSFVVNKAEALRRFEVRRSSFWVVFVLSENKHSFCSQNKLLFELNKIILSFSIEIVCDSENLTENYKLKEKLLSIGLINFEIFLNSLKLGKNKRLMNEFWNP